MDWTGFGDDLLWRLPLQLVGGVVTALVVRRLFRARGTATPEGERALSVECWTRVAAGEHPRLSHRWRVGRAVVSPRRVELTLFRWGLRFTKSAPFVVEVDAVDREGLQRAGWLADLRFDASSQLVPVSTTGGVRLLLAVPAGDVDVVLDLLEGRPLPDRRELEGPWPFPTTVAVTGRPAAGAPGSGHTGDVLTQLHRCLDDVEHQLTAERMSLADLVGLRVRTTDSHAVAASVREVAQRLRDAGAAPVISALAVERLDAPDQLVEVDATATAVGLRPSPGAGELR